jgi:ribosome-associated protein
MIMQEYEDIEENDFDDDVESVVSKSQKKREMHELLALTEKALSMNDEKLQQTGLDEKVILAMREARKMKPSGARNRQLKYITKLIKNEDTQVLEDYLHETEEAEQLANRHFHQLEKWRDRLIQEGDSAISDFMQDYPLADRQQLRTLVRQGQKESEQGKAPSASRKLFKYLRSLTE